MARVLEENQAVSELTNVPIHVAIVMDGNGRWARQRGMPRLAGHHAGTENIRRILSASVKLGIKVLTLYAFSTENWGRPQEEVMGLLNIFEQTVQRELPELHQNGVQLRHIGRLDGLSPKLQKSVREAMDLTSANDRLILNLAFNYGGRQEILDAVRAILSAGIPPEQITEDLFRKYLTTGDLPDPDLIIRTGGEMRLSNYLLWQAAYAEYYSTPVFWPDFDENELRQALVAFGQRKRRFGKLDNS